MRVASLRLTNVRGIKTADFHFRPEFNLIVGVNGIGKTTVLDALRFCLGAFLRKANRIDIRGTFAAEDIRVGADDLEVRCVGRIGSATHTCVIHRPREAAVSRGGEPGMPDEPVRSTPAKTQFLGPPPPPATGRESGGRPLAVLYSTKRAVTSNSTKRPAAERVEAAFADALKDAGLQLREFADWMRAQQALQPEWPPARRVLEGLQEAIRRFLPEYARLREDDGERTRLVIDREGGTVPVRQLSDGERGVLCMVLDLSRRLVQANPDLENLAALKHHRRKALAGVLDWWEEEGSQYHGRALRERLERQRAKYDRGGQLTPYCQVAIWWLDQRLGGGAAP